MPRFVTIPALIDPHVHFRTPGFEHKEDWGTAGHAALMGGVTMVFDMPNTTPATTTLELVQQKKSIINQTLEKYKRTLRYHVYLGASTDNIQEISRAKKEIVGVKLFMGASTGSLLVDDENNQAEIFQECARLKIPLAVHAEDEATLQKAKTAFTGAPTIFNHGTLRPRDAAIVATERAIRMAEKYGTTLYVLHVSTKEEIELVRSAKKQGIAVYAEVTPHHLFLTEDDLHNLGNLGKMNPPLRTGADQTALWAGIHDGTVDTIGTDHAPHTLEEKALPYTEAPSGVPGIETYLALLLDAHNKRQISLEQITRLCRTNIQKIFKILDNNDTVTIDVDAVKTIRNEDMTTKCTWSPFAGTTLKGWPIITQIKN
ncbi:MAG TPA: dihydroorotase [Candidatus Magasanikbacteria bacterium]|nr:MAG: hypothetical protein A3I74_01670 [Candidatus Magasanikbacteria bacterium RIFCSPLOWO2_02_FULL_47_16]OGH79865.1 MAG: hypothetical protein A3C10_00170 [Candidatus Magasanikbacteria bacterium RIFCSPHIGHO2_02_FULL_48_18]HAZ28877.1 dihydroorotase [Candidatus Magasanikbacteria bacterium]